MTLIDDIQWRFIVTNLEHETTTWLDHLAMDRSVTVTRNAAREISMRVPSDNPEVNIPMPMPDGDPFVHEGSRFLIGFRREGRWESTTDAPWRCRAAGLIMDLADRADGDHATTQLTAYDPWKYLYRRPVLQLDGDLPNERGIDVYAGVRPDEVIIGQLILAETYGSSHFIDYGQAGGGGFYTGVIEECAELEDGGDGLGVSFPPGASLGEMLDTFAALGTCDIYLEPIYDPLNRPGFLAQISIFNRQGDFRPEAIVGWDAFPRNATVLSRGRDGTERGNRMKFYASNNLPVLLDISNADSIAKYGDYWSMQTFPGQPSLHAAELLGDKQLALVAYGQITYEIALAAERAIMPFLEFDIGDTIPVYSKKRFREAIPGERVRVESIPFDIADDNVERINNLLVSLEPEAGS